ncbi:hypothetical protein NX774_01065 [Massilia agilis]|uniref:Uncharacterized protein n=1 Tax=Massilia agilis TaxID=1811226 RepID=A0ABT2D5Z0_9BURK|nr:hypothetical protein [Massilia agilis]MCS0806513.1 hypothetical protein [Massilia agilis]
MSNNRFSAGCLNEVLFADETISKVTHDGPVGTIVPITLNDPLYSGPGWHKWQTENIKHSWNRETNVVYVFRIQIHYMYNDNTRVIQQVKFKNSFEYGCLGIKQN